MTKRCFTYGSDGGLETFATEIAARFERLTPAQQEQACQLFEDAHPGDGYRYQNYNDHRVDPDGQIIVRHIVGNAHY
ncbi:TPA: hypothetical protein ACPVE0_003883 [Escherichia coli]